MCGFVVVVVRRGALLWQEGLGRVEARFDSSHWKIQRILLYT